MISPPDALTVTASGVHAISSSVRRMGVTPPASIRLTTSFRLSRQPGLSHYLEDQVSSQRFDLTTAVAKTVIPTAENMSAVFGKDGVETDIQVGQMRQTLGKPGFDWLFNKH